MLYDSYFKNPGDVPALLDKIRVYTDQSGPIRLMEICGTHTMAIARAGLKSLLPENIRLISGPGCPVCVTPAGAVDELLRISSIPARAAGTACCAGGPRERMCGWCILP